MSDTVERYRKFCKIVGLHSVFKDPEFKDPEDNFYNTSSLEPTKVVDISNSGDNTLPITKNTILFITADSIDEGNRIEISTGEVDEEDNKIRTIRTLSEFDTMLWVNGNIYSLSQKNVKTVFYNKDTKQLDIVYSDDNTESIDVTDLQVSKRIAVKFPLSISEEEGTDDNGNEEKFDYIRLFGQNKNDSGRNFVIGMYDDSEDTPEEDKNAYENYTYTTIIGKGNKPSENRQIILGDFNEEDHNSKFIVCNGESNSKRKNLFTIANDGDVSASKDFIISSEETNKITHKLSDIHSVIEDDWYKESKNNSGTVLPDGYIDK